MLLAYLVVWLPLFGLAAMASSGDGRAGSIAEEMEEELLPAAEGFPIGPLTKDFRRWLRSNGYTDLVSHSSADSTESSESSSSSSRSLPSFGSFGGRDFPGQKIRHRPVLFVHGNSDGALQEPGRPTEEEWNRGWSASIAHFLAHGGYSRAELYAITYGDRNLSNALKREIDCPTAQLLHNFVHAILDYTGSPQIDIIAHSMGVTLARVAIHGDIPIEKNNPSAVCRLGPPIPDRVHTFVGIAGANYGLCMCADGAIGSGTPACGREFGFWTGPATFSDCTSSTFFNDSCAARIPKKLRKCSKGHYGTLLEHLNRDNKGFREATKIISLWSDSDQVIGPTNRAFGSRTSLIPGSNWHKVYHGLSHHALKWATVADQLAILQEKMAEQKRMKDIN